MTVNLLFGLIALGIAASVAYRFSCDRGRARMAPWRQAARAAGLKDVNEHVAFQESWLEGRSGALRVRLEHYRRGQSESGTRFLVHGLGGGDLFLRREDLRTALGKRVLGIQEVVVGAPDFDAEVYVQGREPVVFALLDVETRRLVAHLLSGKIAVPQAADASVHASIAEGVLRTELAHFGFRSDYRIPSVLLSLLVFARRLVPPSDLASRIAGNLRHETEPGVRRKALVTLRREFPTHPATRETLLALRRDPSAEVRLEAGIGLGEEGRPILLALASSETAPESCSAAAVTALGEALPRTEVEAILRHALEAGRLATAVACVEALGRPGATEAEPALLEALRHPDAAVALAAAGALGRAGTVVAVGPLHELEARETSAGATVRRAVAEIQSRLTGASPGQLSLAGSEAGALALVEAETGRLSLVDAPPKGDPPEA